MGILRCDLRAYPILTPINAMVVKSIRTNHQSAVIRASVRGRIVRDALLAPITCNLRVGKVQDGVYRIQVDVTAGAASLTQVAAKVSK